MINYKPIEVGSKWVYAKTLNFDNYLIVEKCELNKDNRYEVTAIGMVGTFDIKYFYNGNFIRADIPVFKKTDTILGEILEIDADDSNKIAILCWINPDDQIYSEVRYFDKLPLQNVVELELGWWVKIIVTTENGVQTFAFSNASEEEVSFIIEKEEKYRNNLFKGLENSLFFTEG